MKLAIVGGRDFNNYDKLQEVVGMITGCIDVLFADQYKPMIISGGAKGADSLAEDLAIDYEWPYKEFPADWDKYGKSAGFRRNQQIVDACDVVLAFWDGKSKGTRDTINKAKVAKKPTFIIYY